MTNGITYSFISSNTKYHASSGQAVQICLDSKGAVSLIGLDRTTSGKITYITDSNVTIGGKTYTMSDKVQFYVKKSYEYTMLTLDELKGMMSDYTASIYQDKSESAGGRVRVIVLS